MENQVKKPIQIDGKTYDFDSLTDEQKYLFNQILSIDGQINELKFRADQLQASRSVFAPKLSSLLNEPEVPQESETPSISTVQ